jgi:hypothetical protein
MQTESRKGKRREKDEGIGMVVEEGWKLERREDEGEHTEHTLTEDPSLSLAKAMMYYSY